MELDTFNACVQEAIRENQEQGKHRVAMFEEKHLVVGPAPPFLPRLPSLCTPDSLRPVSLGPIC